MAAWSSLFILRSVKRLNCSVNKILNSKNALCYQSPNYISVRNSGGHNKNLLIRASRYEWKKFMDLAYFYMTIGILPILTLVLYCNIFIGESELIEIPEGYTPEKHEYYSHPITRFMAKHLPSRQQVHEINCHKLFEEKEKSLLVQTQLKVRQKMEEKGDYQAWYFMKPQVKYPRKQNELTENLDWNLMGSKLGVVDEEPPS